MVRKSEEMETKKINLKAFQWIFCLINTKELVIVGSEEKMSLGNFQNLHIFNLKFCNLSLN